MASDAPPTPRFFYGWIILTACFLITLVASGTMMAFGVFITPLANDMGWSHSALSFTYALSSIVSGVGILIVGSLLHSHSVRQLLLYGILTHGLGLYMTSTVTSIEGFYFYYGFLASLGRSVFFISITTLITRWFQTRRGMAMGLTMSGNGIGPFIFSPVVTWLIFNWDWQTAFLVMSVCMTFVLLLSYLFLRDHPHDVGCKPYGAVVAPAPAVPRSRSQAVGPKPDSSAGSLWGKVLRLEGFWSLSWINFFCCLCHSIPLVHVVGFAQTVGLSAYASAWVLSTLAISSVIGRIYWGLFADRHGVRLTLMLTLFMQGTLVLWLINAQDPIVFFFYALFWGFGYGGVGTQYGVVAREVYDTRLFGPGYSGQMCFAMVGMATGGFLGGYLFDISHSYATAWLISFGAGLISAFLAMDLMSQGERAKATPVPVTSESARQPTSV
ncbi:L-lactate transporter [Candidatus Entotheonellaceae bacterium PAL068K]